MRGRRVHLRVLTVESGGKAGGFQNSETMDAESARRIEQRAYARVGFLGNPSDAYFGKTISFSLANFYATVVLEPSPTIRFLPHAVHDPCEFGSLQQMADRIRGEGYYGGVRLLMAACKVFFDVFKHAVDGKGNSLHDRGFTLSYDTNIPRQTGLSGSSAIVWAALKCLLEYFDIPTKQAQVDGLPSLILRVEEELGITAGLQDRVVQVYGGLVYMDFDKTSMESQKKGIYTAMDPELLPPLYLIYCKNPSDSGKVHSDVRKKWLLGDKRIRELMADVAQVAEKGRASLLDRDYVSLATLMDRNFDLRRQIFGDDVLGDINIKMVETARSVGAACKFTGSGGAVVAFCPKGRLQAKDLMEACESAGFSVEVCKIGPASVKHT